MTLNIWSTENAVSCWLCMLCLTKCQPLVLFIVITMNENHTLNCECKMKNIEQPHLNYFTPYKMIKYLMGNPNEIFTENIK